MREQKRELEIRFPGCEPKVTSYIALCQMLREPMFLGYLCVVIIIFSMIDLPNQSDAFEMTSSKIFVLLLGGLIYVSGHFLAVAIKILTTPVGKVVVYYAPMGVLLSGLPSVTFTVVFGDYLGAFQMSPFPESVYVIGMRVAQVMAFEWVFHAFVFGALLKKAITGKNIKFGDQVVSADDLIYVQALEHHVKLVTKSGEHVERSRLKDVIQILGDLEGIQPHRSYWVPKHAIRSAGYSGQTMTLFANNTTIPVAVTRRKEVENWLIANEIEISSTI